MLMRRMTLLVLAALAVCGPLSASPTLAAEKLRVVTSITDLKALTEAVGGDLVEVDSLARSTQNAHDLEARPSLMVKVRRADAIVLNGHRHAFSFAVQAHSHKTGIGMPGNVGQRFLSSAKECQSGVCA